MSTCKKNVIPLQDLNEDVHKLNYNGWSTKNKKTEHYA